MRVRTEAGSSPGGGALSILMLGTEEVTERRSGPEIRSLELARALSRSHEVTVAVPGDAGVSDAEAVSFMSVSRPRLLAAARRRNAVMAHWLPPYMLAGLARSSTLTVADLYDPIDVEAATLPDGPATRRWRKIARLARRNQLRFADLIVCASERQRDAIAGELNEPAVARVHPPEVVVVPFGLGADPPAPTRRPLREGFPAIGQADPLILWWGSIWKWMDAPTAVRAARRLAQDHPTIRLVFTAGVPPHGHGEAFSGASEARSLAASLGLLGSTVFFVEEWIPFAERHEYLQDADVGLNLHRDAIEGGLSARARYTDLLWAGLPSVLTEGNEVAQELAASGFAREVPVGDVEAAARALGELLFDGAVRERAARAGRSLAEAYRWAAVVAPLERALATAAASRERRAGRADPAVVIAAIEYYGRRGWDAVTRRASGLLPRSGR